MFLKEAQVVYLLLLSVSWLFWDCITLLTCPLMPHYNQCYVELEEAGKAVSKALEVLKV